MARAQGFAASALTSWLKDEAARAEEERRAHRRGEAVARLWRGSATDEDLYLIVAWQHAKVPCGVADYHRRVHDIYHPFRQRLHPRCCRECA